MKLLIVEDDQQFARSLKDSLADGFAADLAFNAKDGEFQAQTNEYDLIIIDIVLPDSDGIKLCKHIRESEITTPILMLTGAADESSKVKALDGGADDYLLKPFSLDELKARLRALLRRHGNGYQDNTLVVGDLELNVSTNSVKRNNQEIPLRRKEFCLLEYLMRNPGKVITRSMILDHVWDSDVDPNTNTVDVHIKWLRDKIDRPFPHRLIKTVHGLGYKLEPNS